MYHELSIYMYINIIIPTIHIHKSKNKFPKLTRYNNHVAYTWPNVYRGGIGRL